MLFFELRKQTESLNVNEQNPTRKQTESVNVNEHILLKQLPEGDSTLLVHLSWNCPCLSVSYMLQLFIHW